MKTRPLLILTLWMVPLLAFADDKAVEDAPRNAAEAPLATSSSGPTDGTNVLSKVSALSTAKDAEGAEVSEADAPPRFVPPPMPEESAEIKALKEEVKRLGLLREKLSLENSIRSEEFRKELAPLTEEKERLAVRTLLEREKLSAELLKTRLESDKLAAEAEAIEKKLALEASRFKLDMEGKVATMRREEEFLKATNSLVVARSAGLMNEWKLRAEQIKQEQAEAQNEIARMELRLRNLQTEGTYAGAAGRENIVYTKTPLQDGTLYISDRRISLNGTVTYKLAEEVTERIHYFNNLSTEFPIFIVIDSSPGGSVAAGETILKAMHGSKAPVYVVVKSLAASMAAVIASLAEKSYVYPNAMILHHQLMYGAQGNLKQQQQAIDLGREWFRRIAAPIAERMGLTMDQFIEKMYENDADGNWRVFGDEAQKLTWVTHSVDRIRETSLLSNPDLPVRSSLATPSAPAPQPARSEVLPTPELIERVDAQGKPYIRLPRLQPFDWYFLFNPDNYYRLD